MRLRTLLSVVAVLALAGVGACRSASDGPGSAGTGAQSGGRLIATYRTEPTTYNRIVASKVADEVLGRLTQATLVRVNRATGDLEPRLAESWTSSPDALTWTFQLRRGVKFSDGAPFTSGDVVFTFRAIYDEKVASDIAPVLKPNGKPLQVRALDEHSVVVVFPGPYGPGISVLDSVPIMPRHKLEAALDAGNLRDVWTMKTAVSELTGLGPFRVKEYVASERMVLERNPHFWITEAGQRLPYLDEIEIQFVPEQNAEVLRLQSGAVDLTTSQARFEDLASLQALEKKGSIRLHPAGITTSPDLMWFNLDPAAPLPASRAWLRSSSFRRAVSLAVDRTAVVNTVFLGEAVPVNGPVTPGHGKWYDASVAAPGFDRPAAMKELDAAGLRDRDGDGDRETADGQPARFMLLTQKGQTVRERTALVVQEHLKQVGVAVDVVALDQQAVLARFGNRDYDAILMGFEFDSFDPARHVDFWMSKGRFHVWHPNQASPSSAWEARIDELMTKQSTTVDEAERVRLFSEARRVLAAEQPALYFAAPRVILATSARVQGVQPSVLAPNILWNAERLSLASAGR